MKLLKLSILALCLLTTASARNFVVGMDTQMPKVQLGFALTDELADAVVDTGVLSFRAPCGFNITELRLSAVTAPSGATIQVDINEDGTSILSTPISIDADEYSSKDASVTYVISDKSIADDAIITIDIDQVGSTTPGTGLKLWIIGNF